MHQKTPGGPVLGTARLFEREDEVTSLAALVERACSGSGEIALVEGPPGIGKTELIAETRALAEARGMTVLYARGGELETEFAFGVARQLFEPRLGQLGPLARREALAGAASLTAPLLAAAGSRGSAAPAGEIFPLLHGLYWLCANMTAAGPHLIAIDDAHWADAPSLRWLHYLARRREGLSLLIVLAARSTAPEAPVDQLEAIRAEPGTTELAPEPLTAPASAALLEAFVRSRPDAEFVRAAHDGTGGNPFLLTELAKVLVEDRLAPVAATSMRIRELRPQAISRTVAGRLGRLPPGARALAQAAAVLGTDAALHHAGALAGLDEGAAAEATDQLVSGGLLQPGRPLRFAHPLIREAIYGDLPGADRAFRHKRAARMLWHDSASPERIAAHHLVADAAGDAEVVVTLRAAAAHAWAQGAPETAADYLRRALAEPPSATVRFRVLLELGKVESEAALSGAAAHLLEAFRLAADADGRAEVVEAATGFLLGAGRTVDAIEMANEVLNELSATDRERALQLEAQLVGAALLDPSSVPLATARLERVSESLPGDSVGELMMLCHLAYRRTWRAEAGDLAGDLAWRAVGDGRLVAERGLQPELFGPIMALVCADRLDDAGAVLETWMARARAQGSGHAFSFISCMRAELALRRGDVLNAEVEARAALEITLQSGLLLGSAVNVAILIHALLEQGAADEAEKALDVIGLATGDIPTPAPFNILVGARGRLRLTQGDPEGGLDDLLACGRRNEVFEARNPIYAPWRAAAALAHRAIGDPEAASSLAAEELAVARAWGTPGTLGSAQRLCALFAGDADEAIDGLRHAVASLERSPARLEHAKALVDLGAALRRANHRTEARGPLSEGLDLARRCGASVLAERAHEELLATGSRPRRQLISGVESLTASERRVARMAAEGLSNPEIAQALFVTRKTVETQLSSAYRKLAISSRDELGAALS